MGIALFDSRPSPFELYPAFPACICSCITEEMRTLRKTRLRDKEATLSICNLTQSSNILYVLLTCPILADPHPKPGSGHHLYPVLNDNLLCGIIKRIRSADRMDTTITSLALNPHTQPEMVSGSLLFWMHELREEQKNNGEALKVLIRCSGLAGRAAVSRTHSTYLVPYKIKSKHSP